MSFSIEEASIDIFCALCVLSQKSFLLISVFNSFNFLTLFSKSKILLGGNQALIKRSYFA
tara:strand:+ start:4103 stop:4282 length:180 start_codon:yes stop_codon:yes gene_type:complete